MSNSTQQRINFLLEVLQNKTQSQEHAIERNEQAISDLQTSKNVFLMMMFFALWAINHFIAQRKETSYSILPIEQSQLTAAQLAEFEAQRVRQTRSSLNLQEGATPTIVSLPPEGNTRS